MRTTPEARRIMVAALIAILIAAALDLAGVMEIPTPVSALMPLASLGMGVVLVLGKRRPEGTPEDTVPEPRDGEEKQ